MTSGSSAVTKFGSQREKTCLRGFANNTGADMLAHPRILISAFVFRFLASIICKLATDEISIFWLVNVAKDTGLKLALSDTPRTGFLAMRPIWCNLQLTFYSVGLPNPQHAVYSDRTSLNIVDYKSTLKDA